MLLKVSKTALLVHIALLSSVVLSSNVYAKAEKQELETIEVKGNRLQNMKTIELKRSTDSIADLVVADDIGKQPDFNIGDALKRITGVSTIPEEDEGQFVSVRGINPDLTWVTVDGAAVASASEGERRRVSLEFFPASMVQSLEVIKSRTPEMDGNTIGGQVNLKTRSALENPGLNAVVTGMLGNFNANNAPVGLDDSSGDNSASWRIDGTFSNTFGDDEQFGVVVSASYFSKDRDEERIIPINFQNTEGFENSNSRYAPNLLIWSTYNNPIDRHGLFGKFEYRVNDNLKMALQGQRFYQDDYARRESEILVGGKADFAQQDSGTVTGASFSYGLDQFNAENTYTGFQYELDYNNDNGWQADFRLSSSKGEFYQDTPDIDFNSTTVNYDYEFKAGAPYISFKDPTSALNPENHSLNRIRPTSFDYDNKINEVEFSLGYNYNYAGWGYKAGGKVRQANQTFITGQDVHNYIGNAATLVDFNIETNYSVLFRPDVGSLHANGTDVLNFLANNPDQFDSTFTTPSQIYSVDEDVSAIYLAFSYVADQYKLIFGGRYEQTDVTSVSGDMSQNGEYGNFLPSASLAYDLNDDMLLRLSYARALGRANIGDLKISNVNTGENGIINLSGGNPDLEPRISDNFDVSWEYYFGDSNMLSVAVFNKSIKDEIFRVSTVGTLNGQDAIFNIPQNASDATLNGLEVGLVINELPSIFDDFGFTANYTYIDAETTLLDAQGNGIDVDFVFEQPENIFNATVFYQKEAFEAQLSMNYSDNYHSSFAGDPGFYDEFDAYKTIDFQARYDWSENLILIGEIRNLTEEPLERRTAPGLKLLNDKSEFGRSYFVGATYKF